MFALNAIFLFKSPFLFVFCGICAIVEGVEEAVAGAGIVQQQVVRRPKAPNVATTLLLLLLLRLATVHTMCCLRILLSLL